LLRHDDPSLSRNGASGKPGTVQVSPENPDTSLVSLFWRDRPQDGGNDVIKGGPGDDRLFGGGGHDRLTGDTGDTNVGFDDFVFDRHDGTDTITDFQIACPDCLLLPGQPVDEIVLLDAAEADIDTVVAGVTVDIKGSAVLHYGETDIALIGIQPGDVSVDWFQPG
jgi:hypothetical protein